MRRVLAVDGGQSTIRVRSSERPEVIERDGVSHQEGDTVAAVVAAVLEAWRSDGSPAIDRVVLGLTTAPSDEASRARLCAAVATGTGASEVWLSDDAVTAHAGALSMDWGVSLTVGTGVACLAVPERGAPRLIGGHGFLLGDEGGGFWMGREGLRAALRASDGRGEPTILAERAAIRLDGLDELGARMHASSRPVDRIARFAPEVTEAAEAGDRVAATIVDEAVEELTTLVRAGLSAAAARARPSAHDALRLSPARHAARVPVALGGRLLRERSLLRRRLDASLAPLVEAAQPRSADGAPLDGALLLGRADDPGRYGALVYRWGATGGSTMSARA